MKKEYKKLKDIEPKEFENWKDCYGCQMIYPGCDNCPFEYVYCHSDDWECWVNHKDLYSEKFLNKELEIRSRR